MADAWQYGPQGTYDAPRPEASADAQRLGQYPGMTLQALAEPFLRALLFSQQASDAGGFSQLPPGDVGRESALMGLSMMGGGLAAGGAPSGALAQHATETLAEKARDLIMRGALPGAAAGGAYAAVDGSDVRQGMMAGAGLGAAGRGAWNVADDIHSSGIKWPGSGRGAQQGQSVGPSMSQGGQVQSPQTQISAPGSAQNYRSYQSLPSEMKQNNRDAYVAARALRGDDLPPSQTARGIKEAYTNSGVNVPVTPARVKNTNEAVNEFIRQNGRPPTTRDEWASIWSNRTLAVPAAAAGAGVGYGDLEDF